MIIFVLTAQFFFITHMLVCASPPTSCFVLKSIVTLGVRRVYVGSAPRVRWFLQRHEYGSNLYFDVLVVLAPSFHVKPHNQKSNDPACTAVETMR